MKKLITLMILLLSLRSEAGTVADLGVEVEINDLNGLVIESKGTFIVHITNYGPDIAAAGSGSESIGSSIKPHSR